MGPRGDQYFAALQRGPPCAPSSENRPPAHLNLHVDVTHTHTHAHAHTDHSPRPCPAVSLERHVVASRRPDWVDRGAVVRPPPCHRLQLPRSLHALRRRVQLQLASPVARWHDPKDSHAGSPMCRHAPHRGAVAALVRSGSQVLRAHPVRVKARPSATATHIAPSSVRTCVKRETTVASERSERH